MASDEPLNPMAESGVTIRSDSEQYSAHDEPSASPPSSSSPAVILYQPPTIWSIIRGAAINLFLPFVNGMMLGFGELFAHEAAFRLGWSNTRALPKSSIHATSRQFGTALRNSNGAGLYGASTTRRIAGPLAATAATQQLLFSLRQSRNASTQAAIPSMMQTVLESVYVYTGLPWWASIALVALGIRAALFKPSLAAAENGQIYQELLKDPKYTAATDEMKRMLITGNHLAGAEARARVSIMNKNAGYALWRNFVPMLQLPIGLGIFRVMNGMASLPVPSFEHGGLLWFTDLAVSDPFFILPIAAGIAMMAGMRAPLPYMAPQQQKTMRMMALVVMPITTVVGLFLPAGVQFYFLITSLLHWAQAWLTHQGWFRRMVGLRPLARATDAAPGQVSWQAPRVVDMSAPRIVGSKEKSAAKPAGSESIFSSIKSTLDDAKGKLSERVDRGSDERAQKAAREYDEKRALEERERTLARLQRRRSNKEDRY
ncbi:hypothetical protein N0V88_007486 [Collariella sp. IMI 366227]|nr:hypothetical protein N0V88_007486 [Collariella sp. IMI 366227]